MKMKETLVIDILIGLEGRLMVSHRIVLLVEICSILNGLFQNMKIITIKNFSMRIVHYQLLMIYPVIQLNLINLLNPVFLTLFGLMFCSFGY